MNSERVTAAISKAENKSHFDDFVTKLVELLTHPISDAVKLMCSQSSKKGENVEGFPLYMIKHCGGVMECFDQGLC